MCHDHRLLRFVLPQVADRHGPGYDRVRVHEIAVLDGGGEGDSALSETYVDGLEELHVICAVDVDPVLHICHQSTLKNETKSYRDLLTQTASILYRNVVSQFTELLSHSHSISFLCEKLGFSPAPTSTSMLELCTISTIDTPNPSSPTCSRTNANDTVVIDERESLAVENSETRGEAHRETPRGGVRRPYFRSWLNDEYKTSVFFFSSSILAKFLYQ